MRTVKNQSKSDLPQWQYEQLKKQEKKASKLKRDIRKRHNWETIE